MIEVEATKKLFEAIKLGVNEILSRDGKKLLCDHGICLEVVDILGLAVRSSLPFIHSHNGGYVICDVVSLVIERLGIELGEGIDLVSPAGEWGETRWRLCRELLSRATLIRDHFAQYTLGLVVRSNRRYLPVAVCTTYNSGSRSFEAPLSHHLQQVVGFMGSYCRNRSVNNYHRVFRR